MTDLQRAVSIVIPCRNEAARIGATLAAVRDWAGTHLTACEILVVDDGSTDDTAAVVRRTCGDAVTVVRLDENRGKGHAIRRGVERASLPLVLFLDADHAVGIEHLDAFLPHARRAAFVIGSKRLPGADVARSGRRGLAGRLGQALIRLLAVPGIHDSQCGFKLAHTDVARELLAMQRIERFGFDFELLFLARRFGHAIVELPVRCVDAGDGSVRPSSYLRTLAELFGLVGRRLTGGYPRRPARAGSRG
ncbi:MAG: glycosyltransferase [Planctomycetes bacterium]|nr:glycosyltransferase [Planctomycetota bacterium]